MLLRDVSRADIVEGDNGTVDWAHSRVSHVFGAENGMPLI